MRRNRAWALESATVKRPRAAGRQDRPARRFSAGFAPEVDLPGVAAAAADAYTGTITRAEALRPALDAALAHVGEGRPAVLSVHIPPVEHAASVPGPRPAAPGQERGRRCPG
jgi:hypothetical protein